MIKADAERGIRSLCHQWRKAEGFEQTEQSKLSFYSFLAWVRDHHGGYLAFRTTTSVIDDVERWFEDELRQTAWR